MKIEFKKLTEIDQNEIMALMNNVLVQRQMPLLGEHFTAEDCEEFLATKHAMWEEFGYGPWAFVVDGRFAGWGGLQPENGEADLGLVLHPDYWGLGRILYQRIMDQAFGEMGFKTVTVLLPPSRKRVRGLLRLGFEKDGELIIEGERFLRYRLNRPQHRSVSGEEMP
jgi:ribosomal-protein-alanine N-acetyltransferase